MNYPQTIRRLQKLADGHRDVAMRSFEHVANQHQGLPPEQIEELEEVRQLLDAVFLEVKSTLDERQPSDQASVRATYEKRKAVAATLYDRPSERIRGDVSKTRLSILYYAVIGNAIMLSRQTVRLLGLFDGSFRGVPLDGDEDLR